MSKIFATTTSISILLLLVVSVPVQAMLLNISFAPGNIINDNDANDLNPAIGIIEFNETVTSTGGTYQASGTLTQYGSGTGGATQTNLQLTDLDIIAISGPVTGSLAFGGLLDPSVGAAGSLTLDGFWTSGASNAPANISGSSVSLTGDIEGEWGQVLDNHGFASGGPVDGYMASSVISSGAGSSFNTGIGGGGSVLILITNDFFGQTFYSNIGGVSGALNFDLANAGDGLWLPGSAIVSVSAVPVPAAIWLFGSGLIAFIGMARRRTNASLR